MTFHEWCQRTDRDDEIGEFIRDCSADPNVPDSESRDMHVRYFAQRMPFDAGDHMRDLFDRAWSLYVADRAAA